MAARPPIPPGKARLEVRKVKMGEPEPGADFVLYRGDDGHPFRVGWIGELIPKAYLDDLYQRRQEKGPAWADWKWSSISSGFHKEPDLIAPHAREQILVLCLDETLFMRHGGQLYDQEWLTTRYFVKWVGGVQLEWLPTVDPSGKPLQNHEPPALAALSTGDPPANLDPTLQTRLAQMTSSYKAGYLLRKDLSSACFNPVGPEGAKAHKYLMMLGSKMEPIPGITADDLMELISRVRSWNPPRGQGAVNPELWPLIEQISVTLPYLATESKNRTLQLGRALLNLIAGQPPLAGILEYRPGPGGGGPGGSGSTVSRHGGAARRPKKHDYRKQPSSHSRERRAGSERSDAGDGRGQGFCSKRGRSPFSPGSLDDKPTPKGIPPETRTEKKLRAEGRLGPARPDAKGKGKEKVDEAAPAQLSPPRRQRHERSPRDSNASDTDSDTKLERATRPKVIITTLGEADGEGSESSLSTPSATSLPDLGELGDWEKAWEEERQKGPE